MFNLADVAIYLDESLKNLVGIFPDRLYFNLAIVSTVSLDVIRLNLNERERCSVLCSDEDELGKLN